MIQVTGLAWLREARVWFDEGQPALYQGDRIVRQTWAASAQAPGFAARRIAVEVLTGRGGHNNSYGLLGADWFPSDSGKLDADIHVCQPERGVGSGAVFQASLASRLDQVLIGLPREYSQAVAAGLLEGVSTLALIPAGTLTIQCGAHGMVGSSEFFFRWLAIALVRLFGLPESGRTADIVGPLIIQCRPKQAGPDAASS
jgi:hypothetical protein